MTTGELPVAIPFEPQFVVKVWGGRKLEAWGKKLPPEEPVGESWEISGRRERLSKAAKSSGTCAGKTLYQLGRLHRESLFGARTEECLREFPLLFKLIDASDVLSVQVHPGDEYARKNEGQPGKTEAWMILEAEKDSVIYCGLEQGTTKKHFRELLAAGELQQCLHRIPVAPGDFIYIPSGTVHAIGAGVMLAEIQQPSDVTYRVFDWNRAGLNGKPRELHIERALDVIDFSAGPRRPESLVRREVTGGSRSTLVAARDFSVERIDASGGLSVQKGTEAFDLLCVLEGEGEIRSDGSACGVSRGLSLVVPACVGNYTLCASSGTLSVLRMSPP